MAVTSRFLTETAKDYRIRHLERQVEQFESGEKYARMDDDRRRIQRELEGKIRRLEKEIERRDRDYRQHAKKWIEAQEAALREDERRHRREVNALRRALDKMEGVKWRTGATMGPCHGGRCTARIVEIMERELGADAPHNLKRLRGSDVVVGEVGCESGALAELSGRCAEFAREARADLDARGLREIGSGALGMCGTRPAGVYSCLQTLGLVGVCGRAPGHRAVVWGTHDLALRTALCLLDAGVSVECVLETREAPWARRHS